MTTRREGVRTAGLLTPPMLWLGVVYLGSLATLFVASFWGINEFTTQVEKVFTWKNYDTLVHIGVYKTVALRTLGIAVLVTVVDAVLAFPVALFMAKVAKPRLQRALVIAVLMPLWASYLVKAYAWRGMLSEAGPLSWLGISPGYGGPGLVLTLAYLWLPYMILPIYAGLERLPGSLTEASADLGASSLTTLRRVVLPVVFPALVAGSIFTFSLTLGDYIAVEIVGGTYQVLGGVVYDNFASNLPFAAAYATVPVVIMLAYLALVRRTGALEQL